MNSNNNIKALKSGIWYTAANFITKAIGFITTPIFTRLLSHADYGLYSNYASWVSVFMVFSTFNLGTTFISARYDYSNDFDGYVSSTLVFSSITTGILALFMNLFSGFFVSFTGVELEYLNIMMIYLLLYSAVDMFQTRERYYYEYKISVATSLCVALTTALLSVLLVVNMENKLLGRIIGSAAPTIVIGLILYIIVLLRGKKVSTVYWKYALPICIPFIPHVLSMFLLNSMDKMMITKICGAEENALYSVAYSCGAVITLLVTSLNTAFSPWLGEKLNGRAYDEIRKISKKYILLFVYGSCGIMLLTPELLLVMGGESYSGAISVMPPVAFGCVCQFIYTMYVNVEQFKKKTVGMAIASVIAAFSNYILNSVFIPRYGYIAAAYTTLASFMILLFIHMYLVHRMGLHGLYPTKIIFLVLTFMTLYTLLMEVLYSVPLIRYSVLVGYFILTVFIILRHRDLLFRVIKQKK